MSGLGTFVRVFWRAGGGSYTDFPDDSYNRFVSRLGLTGGAMFQENTVIGTPCHYLASEIGVVMLSTPEGREYAYERDRLWKEEENSHEQPEWDK